MLKTKTPGLRPQVAPDVDVEPPTRWGPSELDIQIGDARPRMLATAALVFAALMMIGFPMLALTWDGEDPNEILAWYEDGGNRSRQLIGGGLVAAAGLAFAWMVTELRSWLSEPRTARLVAVMSGSGGLFSALLFTGAAAIASISAGIAFAEWDPPTNPDIARQIETFGYTAVLMFAYPAAAVCIAAACRAGQVTGRFPTWLVVTGYIAAALSLFAVLFLPIVAIPVFLIALGVWGLGGRRA